jgi:hypothetical protein
MFYIALELILITGVIGLSWAFIVALAPTTINDKTDDGENS